MAIQSVDGAVVGSFVEPLVHTKVMHSPQREIVLIGLNITSAKDRVDLENSRFC